MSNKGKGRQHINVLHKSHVDTIVLGEAVETRFIEVTALYFQHRHEPIVPPEELTRDLVLWRAMVLRHRGNRMKGPDLRNTDDELKSTRRIAQWTLKIKAELCGQPEKVVEWGSVK